MAKSSYDDNTIDQLPGIRIASMAKSSHDDKTIDILYDYITHVVILFTWFNKDLVMDMLLVFRQLEHGLSGSVSIQIYTLDSVY